MFFLLHTMTPRPVVIGERTTMQPFDLLYSFIFSQHCRKSYIKDDEGPARAVRASGTCNVFSSSKFGQALSHSFRYSRTFHKSFQMYILATNGRCPLLCKRF